MCNCEQGFERKFEIAEDMFWKDAEPFRIIGGDLHYFRVLPEVYVVSLILFLSNWLYITRLKIAKATL